MSVEDSETSVTSDCDGQNAQTSVTLSGGDFRGPFGYGHRAYRPDPGATYVFEPAPRVLPVNPRRRWR